MSAAKAATTDIQGPTGWRKSFIDERYGSTLCRIMSTPFHTPFQLETIVGCSFAVEHFYAIK